MHDYELERAAGEIKSRKAKRVLVQLPEGLKTDFPAIARELRKAGAEVMLSGDPCFGACDIPATKGEWDLVIHYGHTQFMPSENVIYITASAGLDVKPCIDAAMSLLEDRVGIVTTAQHLDQLDAAKQYLESKGKTAVIAGQVLGCEFSNAVKIKDDVDCFLFIGSGRFHPLGVAFFTGKKTVAADPYSKTAQVIDASAWERDKHLRKEKAFNARTYGIIVGMKPGQKRFNQALQVKQCLEGRGKEAFIVYLTEAAPEKVDYLPFDAFVITACPRIVIDDWKNYQKPVLLPEEA